MRHFTSLIHVLTWLFIMVTCLKVSLKKTLLKSI